MSYQPPNQNEPTIPSQPSYPPPPPYTQYQPPRQGISNDWSTPPPYQQPPPPKRPRRTLLWIILGALLLVGIIGYYQTAASQQTNIPPASTQTSAPTSQPTDIPTVAPLTNIDDIKAEIQSDANGVLTGDNITTDYGDTQSKAVILETTSDKRPLSFIQDECFNMQKAIWTDLLLSIKIVDWGVAIIKNGLPTVYGECVLDVSHASKIDWNNSDALITWSNKSYQDMTP